MSIFMKIKNFRHKYLPPTSKTFMREINDLKKELSNIKKELSNTRQYASEAVWGEVFSDSVTGCEWLVDRSFSPGRWALGYQALYVLFRVLSNVKPMRILELGLGQSTRMITQYASTNPNIEHYVVEHDNEWISFFKKEYGLSENTKIIQKDWGYVEYKEAKNVRVFQDFKNTFQGKKFDLILIDAPLGSDMKEYSRIDVLELLPDFISETFVILIDDTDRSGEKRTVEEICNQLRQSSIPFAVGNYSGKKSSSLICAEKLFFLTTM